MVTIQTHAETFKVSGIVKGEDDAPVEFANVELRNGNPDNSIADDKVQYRLTKFLQGQIEKSFAQLSDESSEFYKKPWQEIHEMLKAELTNKKQ